MLANFVELAAWKSLADINEQSASRVLGTLRAQGKTVSYVNQYLTRVKAFINWCLPERLLVNPLAKLKRANAKKALKRRARRPLAEHELAKLLNACPLSRRLKYAIPAYTGLRRRELAEVRLADLHLDSVIPFIQLRPEQTKTGEANALPLHPFIVTELKKLTVGMPETRLFSSLPEGRTMLRDLTKCGVQQADASGRRADYHGLRHTFAKRLDANGCSHATRRALMRHGSGDQTDGYTLAHLAEMYEAIKRLPSPAEAQNEVQMKTGTDGVVMPWSQGGHGASLSGINPGRGLNSPHINFDSEKSSDFINRHSVSSYDLKETSNRDSVAETGPRSSVG